MVVAGLRRLQKGRNLWKVRVATLKKVCNMWHVYGSVGLYAFRFQGSFSFSINDLKMAFFQIKTIFKLNTKFKCNMFQYILD